MTLSTSVGSTAYSVLVGATLQENSNHILVWDTLKMIK